MTGPGRSQFKLEECGGLTRLCCQSSTFAGVCGTSAESRVTDTPWPQDGQHGWYSTAPMSAAVAVRGGRRVGQVGRRIVLIGSGGLGVIIDASWRTAVWTAWSTSWAMSANCPHKSVSYVDSSRSFLWQVMAAPRRRNARKWVALRS
jgi:hypothetical protein